VNSWVGMRPLLEFILLAVAMEIILGAHQVYKTVSMDASTMVNSTNLKVGVMVCILTSERASKFSKLILLG